MEKSKLKIKYGAIEFEIESDPKTIEKERKAFLDTLPSIAYMSHNQIFEVQNTQEEEIKIMPSEDIKSLPMITEKYQNINIFMNEKGFSSDIDRCLAVIYFMNKIELIESVSFQSIKERMQNAKLPIPKSISVALNSLTSKGYIQPITKEGDNLTNYYIIDSGIDYIEKYMKKDKKDSKRTTKGTKPLESRYSFLTKEIMNLEQYPDFSKLSSSKEKIMLIMYIVKDINKGEYFSINDLKYIISNIFNDKLSDDSIKGVFKNKSSAKYFDKRKINNNNKVYEYKMIQSGFTYLEENVIKKKNN